jgi:hypothetical protein
MSTKQLLRKLEILAELRKLQEVLAELLGNVLAGSIAAALGDTKAKDDLPKFEERLKSIQDRAQELEAESETLDLLMSMGIHTQD